MKINTKMQTEISRQVNKEKYELEELNEVKRTPG